MHTAFEPVRASVPPDDDLRDLVKRIRKLRWMGMQEEAEHLQMTLRGVPHADCVIVVPRDTD